MIYALGTRSNLNLTSVHPILAEAARYAITNSSVDFGVYEGLRTIEKERENIANGTSKLTNPRDCLHCLQSDGFGHAVDLVPFINGAYTWDWKAVYVIAAHVQQFCFRNSVALRWGGVWDIRLNKLSTNLEREVDAYRARREGKAFLDGVHFELPIEVNTITDAESSAKIA